VLGDGARPLLEADHERRRGQCRLGERRVGQVGRVDAADEQAGQPAVADGGEDAGGVAASAAATGSVTGRPPGSSAGSAPASTAPRSPARRGTQASRAPVARASAASAVNAPGTSARRSPARTTVPGRRSASTAGPPQLPSASALSARASSPGRVTSTVACSFCAARVANGARS
jgi:hypothetical protein